MARVFTIESIEGNSNLGNPVFSNYGKMQNYQYLVLSPVKEDDTGPKDDGGLNNDNMQFKVKDAGDGSRQAGDSQAKTLNMKEKKE